ncbi:MFS transporter, SHS family, lactate transporter [Enhydrobacter aerosaccus]|uniref:MFS transporter, SHS family, lactate transporter n=1 Tax=Enhydrobacter aerosaccus TaxID=225324 RepID=A0A1T4L978_9HYPH|nr:MFS transporter [Enhydrobacter aerosaccus]SJZ51315.1 MFS transporter, SHS family, lactate transporter [Enhydrobacter aerosaccus]
MSASVASNPASPAIPWWKEPTKDQWIAYIAAWLGWTLDAFDFTIFLLIMLPISQEFGVPLAAVAAVFTITLWLRLAGATAAGWMADRMGRKAPLMISILWYSICNFIAGFSPSFAFLFFFRALLGIGMGAEWPAGAALAMESWPTRSRGFMSGILQGSWGLGFALSAAAYGLLYDHIGWRGLLWLGILPALAVVWIRFYVKEPPVWAENKRLQAEKNAEVRLPLFAIFKRKYLFNTLTACLWMGSAFCVYYSIYALFSTYLQKELKWTPGMVAAPIFWANVVVLLGSAVWGSVADKWGRRAAIIVPALLAILVTPIYLLSHDPLIIMLGFILQGVVGGSIYGQNPSYLCERFPTEVRATASGFVYHQGAIWGGLTAPILTYFAIDMNMGFALPMMVSTMGFLAVVALAVLMGPETKGQQLTASLMVHSAAD